MEKVEMQEELVQNQEAEILDKKEKLGFINYYNKIALYVNLSVITGLKI